MRKNNLHFIFIFIFFMQCFQANLMHFPKTRQSAIETLLCTQPHALYNHLFYIPIRFLFDNQAKYSSNISKYITICFTYPSALHTICFLLDTSICFAYSFALCTYSLFIAKIYRRTCNFKKSLCRHCKNFACISHLHAKIIYLRRRKNFFYK